MTTDENPVAATGTATGRARTLLAGLGGVVVAAARLWLRHWPVLLVIALLGGAARMAAIWAATAVSDVSGALGFALLVLGPLASVAAIVLMLLALRPGLPGLAAASAPQAPQDPTRGRPQRVVDVLASVLVPFLAVYASYGYLAEDRARYIEAATSAEFFENPDLWTGAGTPDGSRVFVATGWAALAVVLVAVVLRWGIGRLEGRVPATPLGFAGAYVEGFWLVVAAAELVVWRDRAWAWAESRRAVDVVVGWWESFLDLLGPVAGPVAAVVAWAVDVLSRLDDLVVVPLAWLTVGAVVFGRRLAARPLRVRPPRRLARLERVPGPVRRWTGQAVAPVVGDLRARFLGLVNGVRQLAAAGLAPMLVFGLAFLVSVRLEEGLRHLVRVVVGPQPVDTWLAFAPHVQTVTRAVGLTVTMALLAAAVDHVLRSGGALASSPAPEQPQPTQSTASAT